MKFISNIGWMSRNSKSLNVDILNQQYLFNIPLTEISNLVSGKKPRIIFEIPLKKIMGHCTLHPKGNSVIFEIEGKEYSTSLKLLDLVISTGARKPLSEIDNRPESHLAEYSIYDSILSRLITSYPENISKELEKYVPSTIELIKKFHGEKIGQLNYEDPNVQAAYMLCYFPSYIENVYHILTHESCEEIQSIFKNNMKTSFYGCGPSPDFLGYLAFLNKNYRSRITDVNVNFFDMHNWERWRGICVNNFSKIFHSDVNVSPTTNEIDLLKCDDPSYLSEKRIDGTDLHIFQNCTTDLYNQCNSIRKISSIFNNILHQIDPGSIVLINDFLGKGDSMKILYSIKNKIEDDQDFILLNDQFNVNEYSPTFVSNPDVRLFLNHCYKQVGIEQRGNATGYSYLIVQRQ